MAGKHLVHESFLKVRSPAVKGGLGRNGEQQRPRKCAVKAAEPLDYVSFVQHFRQASPYIVGHRNKTFVVVIPGEVSRVDIWKGVLRIWVFCCLGGDCQGIDGPDICFRWYLWYGFARCSTL